MRKGCNRDFAMTLAETQSYSEGSGKDRACRYGL